MTNCTINGNSAYRGGGIYAYSGTQPLTNCTISGNSAHYSGGGIYAYSSSTTTLYNTIIAENYAQTANTDIDGVISSNSSNNLIGFDPGFVTVPVFDSSGTLINPATVNYQLTSSSGAIDRGLNWMVSDIIDDVAGNPRISGGIVDLGAYEFQDTSSPLAGYYHLDVLCLQTFLEQTDPNGVKNGKNFTSIIPPSTRQLGPG